VEKIIVYRQCLHGTIQIQNSTKTHTVPSEWVEKIIVFLKAQPQDQVWEKQSSMAGRFSGRPCSLQAGQLRTPPPPLPWGWLGPWSDYYCISVFQHDNLKNIKRIKTKICGTTRVFIIYVEGGAGNTQIFFKILL
jgi:hypothetical protein